MIPAGARLIDLSHPVTTGMRVFPGDPEVTIAPAASIATDGFEVHALHLGSHSGTHLDAPSHTVAGGLTVDRVPLERLVGRAVVLRATGLGDDEAVEPQHVAPGLARLRARDDTRIALLHTGWDAWFGDDRALRHPVVSVALADALLAAGVDVLGVDTLNPDATVQRGAFALPVHDRLLGSSRFIIENLCGLERVPGDECGFAALPLRLAGVDGSPVRAVAWALDD